MKINLNEYIIDDRIFSEKFSCDLAKCKGACCTMKGDEGAPLLEEEIPVLQDNLKIAEKYLSENSKMYIRSKGFFMKNIVNKYYTNTINDEDCVFVFYENNVAKCAFERAYFNGETEFRKPISCHLFPIRIKGKKRNVIKYEKISECEDALLKGREDNLSIFEFAKDSIIREYGREFFYEAKKQFK